MKDKLLILTLFVCIIFTTSIFCYGNEGFFIQPEQNWGAFRDDFKAKGIYISSNVLKDKSWFLSLLKLIEETELNAVVIDVKDDDGILTYESESEIANKIGANEKVKINNIEEYMEILEEKNIYPIARIVTFKDTRAATNYSEVAIQSTRGGIWKDGARNGWLNPYDEEAWQYPIQLAKEAVKKGFKEVQFDYVRFPTGGNRKTLNYNNKAAGRTKSEAIRDFLSYARKELEGMNAYVSADIFGQVTISKGDEGIGHHLETVSVGADIICPMIYPSHYAKGTFGIKYPDSHPYEIVYGCLKKTKERLSKIEEKRVARVRPWLQDFSATWLKKSYGSNYISYGKKQIQDQIKATYDAGYEEWIFWNAGNSYTRSGFKKSIN